MVHPEWLPKIPNRPRRRGGPELRRVCRPAARRAVQSVMMEATVGEDTFSQSITEHYGQRDILGAIGELLRAAGKDPDAPTVSDLASLDHFHSGGREATLALYRLGGLPPGGRVLDVGGGIG